MNLTPKSFLPFISLFLIASQIVCRGAQSDAPALGNYSAASVGLSANSTVVPDAAPTNAARVTVATSTGFQGRLEADSTTGIVRITNAKPAGTYILTVTAFDAAGSTQSRTFALGVTTTPACPQVYFGVTNVPAGANPLSVFIGDFNRDGNQDLVSFNGEARTVSILLGDGAGRFGLRTDIAVGDGADSLALGDFNGDGNEDLAIPEYNQSRIAILRGDGTGNFAPATYTNAGPYPMAVARGDFNHDGVLDLVVSRISDGAISVVLGDGTGQFGSPVSYPDSATPSPPAVGDFNGDGHDDIVVGRQTASSVAVYLGSGTGAFSAPTEFETGNYPQAVVVADFNGDGKQDLAIGTYGAPSVSILSGNGGGGFSAPAYISVGGSVQSLDVGDFNGDGKQDLAAAGGPGLYQISLLFGDGAGGFASPRSITVGYGTVGDGPYGVAVGDFNRDGMQDVAVANSRSPHISVVLRGCAPTPIVALSRKDHSIGRNFDVPLPQSGPTGIECRTGGATSDYALRLVFPESVTVTGTPQAEVLSGAATIGSGGAPNGGLVDVNSNTVTIPLTGVANAQTLTVRLNGVDGFAPVLIPMSVLVGDTNGDSVVNSGDAIQTRSRSGQQVTATNFRSDVNVSYNINSGDAVIVRSRAGTSLP